MKHVLNLGAGVQSSTMALMAAHGEITPMPDFAVFADTQAEPEAVYRWLDWLEGQLPFPVHRVTAGNLRSDALEMRTSRKGRPYPRTTLPIYTLLDGKPGKVRMRSCTEDYKIRPLKQFVRQSCGITRGQKTATVSQWMGISLDEVGRAKPSRDAWSTHRFPLLELRMRRRDCLDWMREHGYPEPPRSACNFCPFHSNAEWRRLQQEEPDAFDDAVKFEKELQAIKAASDTFDSVPFLHRSLKPLDEIDFRSDLERGQLSLWDDECEGMCGV